MAQIHMTDHENRRKNSTSQRPSSDPQSYENMRFVIQKYESGSTADQSSSSENGSPVSPSADADAAAGDSSSSLVAPILSSESLSLSSAAAAAAAAAEDDDLSMAVTHKKMQNNTNRHFFSYVTKMETTTEETARFCPDDDEVARRGRLFAQRQTRRLIFKDGTCNVTSRNVLQRRRRYLVDMFTTIIEMRWRYNFVLFAMAFVCSWAVFGLLWWAIAVAHGDHLGGSNDTALEPCVAGVYDFTTAFLFSVETQHTIGYGTRVIEPYCPHGTLLLMIQACCGVLIQSLMTGLLFAKLARPKYRANTIIFSQHAVICLRDNEYFLLFRLGDIRSSHIINTSIRALIAMDRSTKEGEMVPLCQYNFPLETETNFQDSFLFLVWPTTVVHRIGPSSPLWDVSAEQLLTTHFEIIVILEGVVESTGNCIQVRTSYLPSEILWGHRLAPLVTYEKQNGRYKIDFVHFHDVIPVSTMPDCSAKEFSEKEAAAAAAAADASPIPGDDTEYPFTFTFGGPQRRHRSSRTSLRRLVTRRKSKNQPSATDTGSDSTMSPIPEPPSSARNAHGQFGPNEQSSKKQRRILKHSNSTQ